MKKLFRLWDVWGNVTDVWFAPVFAFFVLFGTYRDKSLINRIRCAYRDAANYEPVPIRDDEAERKARRKARKPGQLADFDGPGLS